MKDVFHYTRKNYDTIIPDTSIIPNHKYKLSKGENGLVKFVHVDVKQYFFGVAGGIVSQRRHNLKFDQNSILGDYFCSMKHK